MKILKGFIRQYRIEKDKIILRSIGKKLELAKRAEKIMTDKVLKLWE